MEPVNVKMTMTITMMVRVFTLITLWDEMKLLMAHPLLICAAVFGD
jgi:hypothetical protein